MKSKKSSVVRTKKPLGTSIFTDTADTFAVPRTDGVPSGQGPIGNRRKVIDMDKLRRIVKHNATRINDAAGIMEILTDLQLVQEVLVASILSPKDLRPVALNIVGSEDIPGLSEIIKAHFTKEYDLESKLAPILGEALFTHGSFSLLAIPVSLIHATIIKNTTTRESASVRPSVGILGNSPHQGYALEGLDRVTRPAKVSADNAQAIELTDDLYHLVSSKINSLQAQSRTQSKFSAAYALEALVPAPVKETEDIYLQKLVTKVSNLSLEKPNPDEHDSRWDEFSPLVMNPPAESVITAHVPGDPENHVGYYLVIDGRTGNFITHERDANYFKELKIKLDQTAGGSDQDKLAKAMGYAVERDSRGDATGMTAMFENLLDKELRQAIELGTHGDTVEVKVPNNFYQVMFARQLKHQKTRLVYVPASMMTYVAFNYDTHGIGISLLEKTKLYSSLRAILMFASVMAGVKNSVGQRKLMVTLDDLDTDPEGTLEMVMDVFAGMQTSDLPIGTLSPPDIIDGLQRAGVQIVVDGGQSFPGTKMELEEKQRDIPGPDSDLVERLKEIQYSGLSVSPELIDRTKESELATGITQANLLQAKRVMVYQSTYEKHLSNFMRQYIACGGRLFHEIRKAYEDNKSKKKDTLPNIIAGLRIELPRPDTATVNSQKESFEAYRDFVDEAVMSYVNEETIEDIAEGDNLGDAVASIREQVKAHLLRQYMRKQGMLPEMDAFFMDKESNAVSNLHEMTDQIAKIVKGVKSKLIKAEAKLDERLDKVREGEEDEGESTPEDAESTEEPVDNDGGVDSPSEEEAEDAPSEDIPEE